MRPIPVLPVELFTTILTHLPPRTLITSTRVSRSWQRAITTTCKVSWATSALDEQYRSEGDWRDGGDQDGWKLFVDCVYTLHRLRTGIPRSSLLYHAEPEWGSLVVSSRYIALWSSPSLMVVFERVVLGNGIGERWEIDMNCLVGMSVKRPAFVCIGGDSVVVAFKRAWPETGDGREPDEVMAKNNFLCSLNLRTHSLNWLTPLRPPSPSDYGTHPVLRSGLYPLVPHFIFPAQITGPTIAYSNDQFERIPYHQANQLHFTYTILDLRTGKTLVSIPDSVLGDQRCTCCPSENPAKALSKSRYVRDHLATQPRFGLWFARARFRDACGSDSSDEGEFVVEIRSCVSGQLIGECKLDRDGVELEKLYFLKIKILDESISRNAYGKRVIRSRIIIGIQQEGSSVAFDMDDLMANFRGPRSRNEDWIKLWTVSVDTTVHAEGPLESFFPERFPAGTTRVVDPFSVSLSKEKLEHFAIPSLMPKKERYAFTFYNATPKVSILTSCKKDGFLRSRIVEFKPTAPPAPPSLPALESTAEGHPAGASPGSPTHSNMLMSTTSSLTRTQSHPPVAATPPANPIQRPSFHRRTTSSSSISSTSSSSFLSRLPSAAKSALHISSSSSSHTSTPHIPQLKRPAPSPAERTLPDGSKRVHYAMEGDTKLEKMTAMIKDPAVDTRFVAANEEAKEVRAWGKVRFVPDGGVGVVVYSQAVLFF